MAASGRRTTTKRRQWQAVEKAYRLAQNAKATKNRERKAANAMAALVKESEDLGLYPDAEEVSAEGYAAEQAAVINATGA